MKRLISLLFSLLISLFMVVGQIEFTDTETSDKSKPRKYSIGFNAEEIFRYQEGWLTFTLFPVTGYHITRNWMGGIGGIYQMKKNYSLVSNIFGAVVFSNYLLMNEIHSKFPIGFLVHAEHQWLYIQNPYNQSKKYPQLVLTGPGLHQKLGLNSAINLMLLWNVYASAEAFDRPILRINIMF
jgi:hypothetical protein